MNSTLRLLRVACLATLAVPLAAVAVAADKPAGNPIFPGHYADPEATIFGDTYWVYPTYSAPYDEQLFFDCFSSKDLVTWTKHPRILDTQAVSRWARRAMWAPSVIAEGRQVLPLLRRQRHPERRRPSVGSAWPSPTSPPAPSRTTSASRLIGKFHNGAQPIDQFVFKDADGAHYLIYGGWRHCNIARLNDDFTGFVPFKPTASTFKRDHPRKAMSKDPCMFIRNGKYYFMWSEGGWTGPDYSVAYAVADSPFGPFQRIGKVLKQDPAIATGAGHHSVIHVPGTDDYYAVYHRRPLGETDANARVTCVDRMEFDADGLIKPIRITREGVAARPLK